MILEKQDLEQIEKIIDRSVIKSSESIKTELRKEIKDSAEKSKNEIISTLSREITDLAEINCAVIKKVDKINELEKRIIRIETKLGLEQT